MRHLRIALLSLFLALLSSSTVFAAEAGSEESTQGANQRILWLGSSSTYFHDQPKYAAEWLTEYAGIPSASYLAGRSGTAVYKYLETDFKTEYGLNPGETVLDKIRTGRFDVVVLQVPTDYLAGRGDNDRDAFVAGIDTYVTAVRKAGGKPVFYEQGWGDDALFDSGDKLLFELAVKHNVTVAPCRSAWQRIRAERPDIELHNLPDRTHPGTLGAYVNLCCFYAAISGKSPVGLPVRESTYWPHLTDEEKREARERLAEMTVTDPYMKQLAGWMRTRSVASKCIQLDDGLAAYFQRVACDTWRGYNKRVAEAGQSSSR